MADPVVHITGGIPDSGTGNITTLGQTLLDGANVTHGAVADAAVAAGAAGTFAAKLRAISRDVANIVLAAGANVIGAVTQSGTWTVQPGNTPNTSPWLASIHDGTTKAVVKAASTAPVATDPALVVAISPNGVNANGQATMANSAPVTIASNQSSLSVNMKQVYNTVAASATAQALTGGSGGAIGDYLEGILIVPGTTAAGAVSIKDGAGSAISIFAGGGTTALLSLIPFFVPIDAISAAGAWSVTTGTNVTAIATGKFT